MFLVFRLVVALKGKRTSLKKKPPTKHRILCIWSLVQPQMRLLSWPSCPAGCPRWRRACPRPRTSCPSSPWRPAGRPWLAPSRSSPPRRRWWFLTNWIILRADLELCSKNLDLFKIPRTVLTGTYKYLYVSFYCYLTLLLHATESVIYWVSKYFWDFSLFIF